jgi:hypothetical protein
MTGHGPVNHLGGSSSLSYVELALGRSLQNNTKLTIGSGRRLVLRRLSALFLLLFTYSMTLRLAA